MPGGAFFLMIVSSKLSLEMMRHLPDAREPTRSRFSTPSSLRSYVANMVYVGVLANILKIDMDTINQALDFHFKGKTKPIN